MTYVLAEMRSDSNIDYVDAAWLETTQIGAPPRPHATILCNLGAHQPAFAKASSN